ncbi:MAG TPA: 4-hydroxyphenylacetate 3-hydroxylase N-terminal domain-containing protein [Candidatus Binataceae bacterium]|nr:4-hydroxyphenylacetate 3-hydroxylase N-terminal domain-containing protein [Candidatus Binataceae bacterium]
MGLKTAEQYKQSLRDGRAVFFRGEKVNDVTTHPVIGIAVEHACIDYRLAENQQYRELAVIKDGQTEYSRYFHLPRNGEDLLKRSQLIAASTREGATLVVLIKEIGSDALLALHIIGERMAAAGKPQYRDRIRKYHQMCRDNDLAVAVAQTDVKGDRALGPTAQEHPDYYVRVVEERPDGVVVRGAKVHTSVSTNTNEVIVLPTRAMRPEDKAYAIAFALPINTPGLKLIASPHGSSKKDPFEHPISARHKMMETLTVFDDVFVPHDRIFLNGEIDFAGLLALTFVRFHRFTAVSYKLPLLELLAGAGAAVAEANGIARANHVRDKLTHLAAYHTTVRGLIEHAAATCTIEDGIAVPNTLITNVAKYHFAHNYHQAVQIVQDLAGGLLVTAPAAEDFTSEATRAYVTKYLGGAKGFDAETRMRLLNLVADLTASEYGGYQEVLAVHAEGGFEAEKLQAYREYDFKSVAAYARKLAGIG